MNLTESFISLKPKIRSEVKRFGKIIGSIHFIIAIVMILAISILYYGRTLGLEFRWFDNIKLFELIYGFHGSLYSIPFFYMTILYWWRGALLSWIFSFCAIVYRMVYLSIGIVPLLTNIVFASIPLAIILVIAIEFRWREKTSRESARIQQNYMAQIIKAQEDERYRIARELHDEALQTLYAITSRAKAPSAGNSKSYQLLESLEWIKKASLTLSEDIRRLSLDLRPSVLDDMGLLPALRLLVSRLDGNIKSRMAVSGDERRLSKDVEIMVYRIAQEALSNVKKHSNATETLVMLNYNKDYIEMRISDNGYGFMLPKNRSHFTSRGKLGLTTMHERAILINGELRIKSKAGSGTKIMLKIKNLSNKTGL